MWFICDPFGIALGTLTWAMVIFADWVVCRYVIDVWFATDVPRFDWLPYTDAGATLFAFYQLTIALSFISHLRAVTTDPGTISQHSPPDNFSPIKQCKLCRDSWKPPRAHHCKTCRRCIFRMDHHCPWINNCVGQANQKFFILFLGYTSTAAVVTLILLACSAASWLWNQPSLSEAPLPGTASVICGGLVSVECIAVVLFVSDFLQEQIESIQCNSTLVETYQRTHGERSTFAEHFAASFGDDWRLWPWPIHSAPKPNYEEFAIPDDADYMGPSGDCDDIGIAGEEYETSAGPGTPRLVGDQPGAPGIRARPGGSRAEN